MTIQRDRLKSLTPFISVVIRSQTMLNFNNFKRLFVRLQPRIVSMGELNDKVPELYLIGDATEPGRVGKPYMMATGYWRQSKRSFS